MITYTDSIKLLKFDVDRYGDAVLEAEADVPALVNQVTGAGNRNRQETVTADLTAYVDPTNDFVAENANRLENMLAVYAAFGATENASWYKVIRVEVSRDLLLANQIDNIALTLKKTSRITGVS